MVSNPNGLPQKPGESDEAYEQRLGVNARMRFHRSMKSTFTIISICIFMF